MHYRNNREAKNGDRIVQFESQSGKVVAVGTLQNAIAGNDYCNGQLIVDAGQSYGPAIIVGACLCDCLHVEDLASLVATQGLDKRPSGK